MDSVAYDDIRRAQLKQTAKQLRLDAGLTQEEVGRFLGCSRQRISALEDETEQVEYTISEIELLAALVGRHPFEVFRTTGSNAIRLGKMITETQTGSALQHVVDCKLPRRLVRLYQDAEHGGPGRVHFNPDGSVTAAIVDDFVAEDWDEWHRKPYPVTVLCWDTATGALLGERRMPYIEHIGVVDAKRIAIIVSRPLPEVEGSMDYQSANSLVVWNVSKDQIEWEHTLPARVESVAVSPDKGYLAVFFPTLVAMQIWQTSDWKPVRAIELVAGENDPSSIGRFYRYAQEITELSPPRKYGPDLHDYKAGRFDFRNGNVLVVSVESRDHEFDLYSETADVRSPIEYPSSPFDPLAHVRTADAEIAVREIYYHASWHLSQIEMYYLLPRGIVDRRASDIRVIRQWHGKVYSPTIFNDACILSPIAYDTAHRWMWVYKQRLALGNLVSGRVVMLNDKERLQEGDNQLQATLSPTGSAVAYWVLSEERVPRLSIQFIDPTPLVVKGISLSALLHRKQKRNESEWDANI